MYGSVAWYTLTMAATSHKRLLFVPDSHHPYHDTKAIATLIKVAKDWQPHHIVVLGDFVDMYAVSAHDKDPSRLGVLKKEVESAKGTLDLLETTGAEKYTYIYGNHEYRFDRYLWKHAPALHGLVSVDDTLSLSLRGWEQVPYMNHTKIGKLHVTHDCGAAGADAHRKAMKTFGGNVVIGHTHRCGIHYEGNARGECHVGAMFGWLGDIKAIDYTHKVTARAWCLGFGTGILAPNGNVRLEAHPFINYKVRLDGTILGL